MRTRRHDTVQYGYEYVSGILRKEQGRTIGGISRKSDVNEQALQHFISQWRWSGPGLIEAIQGVVKERPELQSGTMLILDESSEEREGEQSVGVSRQYLGRSGKVDQGQVGVFVSLVKHEFGTWWAGELYVPEVWFGDD